MNKDILHISFMWNSFFTIRSTVLLICLTICPDVFLVSHFPKGNNYEIEKNILMKFKIIFSRTTEPISTKLANGIPLKELEVWPFDYSQWSQAAISMQRIWHCSVRPPMGALQCCTTIVNCVHNVECRMCFCVTYGGCMARVYLF